MNAGLLRRAAIAGVAAVALAMLGPALGPTGGPTLLHPTSAASDDEAGGGGNWPRTAVVGGGH